MPVVVTPLQDFAEIDKSRQAEMRQRCIIAQLGCRLVTAVAAGFTLRIGAYTVGAAQTELLAAVQLLISQLAVEVQQQVYCVAQAAAVIDVTGQFLKAAFCHAVKIFVSELAPIVQGAVTCIAAPAAAAAADTCMQGIAAFFGIVAEQAHFILQLAVVVAIDQIQFTAAGIGQGRTAINAEGLGFPDCVQQAEVVAQGIIHLTVSNAQAAAVTADGQFVAKVIVAHIFIA